MNLAIMLVAGQLEFCKLELIIRNCAENFTAVIAANNQMLGLIRYNESG
jgi:hypothetical protein